MRKYTWKQTVKKQIALLGLCTKYNTLPRRTRKAQRMQPLHWHLKDNSNHIIIITLIAFLFKHYSKSFTHINLFNPSTIENITIPTLQLRKLRSYKCWNWDVNMCSLTPEPILPFVRRKGPNLLNLNLPMLSWHAEERNDRRREEKRLEGLMSLSKIQHDGTQNAMQASWLPALSLRRVDLDVHSKDIL